MIKLPDFLKKGDKIAIVCPAKKLPGPIHYGIKVLQEWGLEVVLGSTVSGGYHQFSGTDEERTRDIQQFLDDPEIKAIIAGRGGYGTIRIIDELNFDAFKKNPKWVIGFSDITVMLSHLHSFLQTASIHGQMPMTFEDATVESLNSLKNMLFGRPTQLAGPANLLNRTGQIVAETVGGNLALLINVEGSVSTMDFRDKILFLEDVGEHEYAIDRMMRMLKRAGKLAHLKGLVVGAFNGIEEESIFFGQTPNQVIADLVKEYNYPVAFDMPIGHIDNNQAVMVGGKAKLVVSSNGSTLEFNL